MTLCGGPSRPAAKGRPCPVFVRKRQTRPIRVLLPFRSESQAETLEKEDAEQRQKAWNPRPFFFLLVFFASLARLWRLVTFDKNQL